LADGPRRLMRHRGAVAGLVILGVLALLGIGAPWLSPSDPFKYAPRTALQAPGSWYTLGGD